MYLKEVYVVPRVYKKNKRVSNCPNTVFEVLRSSTILLYSCFDSNKSLCSTKHTQVYFVLRKECL